MFICEFCSQTCGPRISPRIVSLESELRKIDYMGYNEDGHHVVVGSGLEVTAEHKQCPACSGVTLKVPPTPNYHGYVGIASGMWGHAQKCRKPLAECERCKSHVEAFHDFPLPAVATVLTEPNIAKRFKTSLASVVVENMLDRAGQNSKRAKSDFGVTYPILKDYEGRGGSL